MKKIGVLTMALAFAVMTACSAEKAPEAEVGGTTETSAEVNAEVGGKTETNTEASIEESRDAEDLAAFAEGIAKEFYDSYGFDAIGVYSDSDGIVITITGEGSSEWMDHAWDEMIDSINESYNTSKSTMERAGTGDTDITYLVCDTDGVSYLRYVDGEVEDLANGSRQSIQD